MSGTNEYLGYGKCPQCKLLMDPPSHTKWEGQEVNERWYCEDCSIEVMVTSERVAGCHWCKSENSVRRDSELEIWYCWRCETVTKSESEERWYRWVSSRVIG